MPQEQNPEDERAPKLKRSRRKAQDLTASPAFIASKGADKRRVRYRIRLMLPALSPDEEFEARAARGRRKRKNTDTWR